MSEDTGWKTHDGDGDNHGEPEDGWVTAPDKWDTEISAISLCRFSGDPTPAGANCPHRTAGRHPDVDCTTYFLSARAFEMKTLDLAPILAYQRGEIDGAELPLEVRVQVEGGEAGGVLSG